MPSIFEDDIAEQEKFLNKVIKAINKGKTPEEVAKGVHEVCVWFCREAGMKPESETFVRQERPDMWKVSFEAGPYQWAIAAAGAHSNNKVLTEPYWSFDLECSAN